jgi:hypothetical protein
VSILGDEEEARTLLATATKEEELEDSDSDQEAEPPEVCCTIIKNNKSK